MRRAFSTVQVESFSEFNTTITTLRDNYLEFNRLSVAIRVFFIATYYHFIATKQRK